MLKVKIGKDMADKKYVNMELDPDNAEFGRKVSLKIKLKLKESSTVYIILEPGDKNKDPTELKVANRAGIDSSGKSTLSKITEDDGQLEFDLNLSNYGGDTFGVKVAKDKAGKENVVNAGVTYEVWKKLYYQTSKMKNSFSFPFDKVIGEFKDHKIDLEETSEIKVPYKENLETSELEAYKTHFKKTKTPFEAHVVLIDRQCDSKTVYITSTVSKQKTFIEKDFRDWPFSDWLVTANAEDLDGNKAVATVTRKKVAGKNGVEIDLGGSTLDATKKSVDLDIEYKILKGSYTGDATYKPNVFIAVGAPRSDESKSKTVAHEIGHGVGMVPIAGHDLQYDNRNGGLGSHCRHGATPDKVSKAQGGAFSGKYLSGTCVMYSSSSEHYKFCVTCKEFVKEADLSKDAMKARKWG